MTSDDIVELLREEGFITHIARLSRESKLLHEAADEIERLRELSGNAGQLREERDDARRELCRNYAGPGVSVWLIAERRGWDCFKGER